jgi:hypothetical protein
MSRYYLLNVSKPFGLLPAEPAETSAREHQGASSYDKPKSIMSEIASEFDELPVELRLCGALFGLFCDFFLCFFGWRNIYYNSWLLGILLFRD